MIAVSTLSVLRDMRRARKGGPAAIAQRQRDRLSRIVAYAREKSPYYRRLYSSVPASADDVSQLPVTDKRQLMSEFDDWSTDRSITFEEARAFINDPNRVGDLFHGRYRVGTSSGSSGVRGIFLFDEHSTTVTSAMALRAFGRWLGWSDLPRIVSSGFRVASVLATGGHYGSATVLPRRSNGNRVADGRLRVFSVFTPMPELVAQLNAFRPAILVGYAGQLLLLAGEQESGRLAIKPKLVVLGAEGLPEQGYARVRSAFQAKVGNGYGSCEFMSTAASCPRGWLHVNGDWVIVEPVDRDYQPVPPGQASHTVLVTNLANRVQPVLRYDLGDAILASPEACPCGDPFPAIWVRGRASQAMTFHDLYGKAKLVAPVALAGIVDRVPGLDLAQVVQTSPRSLHLRLRAEHNSELETVWRTTELAIVSFLADHGLPGVTVERSDAPPQQSAGGKYQLIIPFAAKATNASAAELPSV